MIEEATPKARYLRVTVVDHTRAGEPPVSVRVPIRLVKFGLKMAERFSPERESIGAMVDEGVTGELVHVEDEAEHKTVDVFVE